MDDPHASLDSGIFRKPLILYVEDHRDTRLAYTALLRRAGFRVREASNGVEGVESALELRPDLVLLDLSLPVVDGYEVMHRIKKNPKTANIPVVILSGKRLREDVSAFCDAFLTKPLDSKALIETVTAVLAWRSTVDAQAVRRAAGPA